MRISSKFAVLFTAAFLAVVMTACGGGASSTGGSNSSGGSSGASASGSPADGAKGFLNAVFTGGDVNSFLCASNAAAAQALSQGMATMKSSLAASGATIDTSGLTFTAGAASGDITQVTVSGSLKVTVAGTSTSVPWSGAAIPVKNENGSWKVCG
ncbi:MAG TPA: hypothetical protein VKQ72_09885 [Aggregatilineales bacterium]|nr:hypothetical protein [Aggregatilineales bacterium]